MFCHAGAAQTGYGGMRYEEMDKRLLVGVVPTRREAFENETTTRQKGEVMKRFRQLSKELDLTWWTLRTSMRKGF